MSLLILYHCQNKVTTLYPFFIFLQIAMRISIPGHVFLNFSGTAQNWMAIVVPPHCPLPRGSSFLELDYWEETYHSEDFSNFIGASPKLDAKWMMHHHDDLSMLMVAPHGCVGWWSWSIFNEKQVVSSVLFACYTQRWYPLSVHLGCVGDAVVFHVGAILSHNWLWTKCFLEEGSTLVLRA